MTAEVRTSIHMFISHTSPWCIMWLCSSFSHYPTNANWRLLGNGNSHDKINYNPLRSSRRNIRSTRTLNKTSNYHLCQQILSERDIFKNPQPPTNTAGSLGSYKTEQDCVCCTARCRRRKLWLERWCNCMLVTLRPQNSSNCHCHPVLL